VEPPVRVELTMANLENSLPCPKARANVVWDNGFEPMFPVWKTGVIPDYTNPTYFGVAKVPKF
jgi:hypothetical protein